MSAGEDAPHSMEPNLRRLHALPPGMRVLAMNALPKGDRQTIESGWEFNAHPGQLAPPGDWRVWLICAGRGFGKTRAGAEWISQIARSAPEMRIALVGATIADACKVMVEGTSGLLSIAQVGGEPSWQPYSGLLTWPNGTRAQVFSAETPEALRGPEHHFAWCDELAKWRYGDAAWDNLMLGLRCGAHPRTIVTTTPKPVMLLRRVMALRGTVRTGGPSHANRHLPASYIEGIEDMYAGTRLARQEIEGELIDEVAGALWTREMLEECRVAEAPAFERVVVAVDPPAGSDGDACGIVAVGLAKGGIAYVIDDASIAGASPDGWARAVAACAARHAADRVVAEKNQGGEMVSAVLHGADNALPLSLVHASKGKVARAEPVAALYERRLVRHVGMYRALEDQLCGFLAGGAYVGPGRSPDRADALVWALTELVLNRRGEAAMRWL